MPPITAVSPNRANRRIAIIDALKIATEDPQGIVALQPTVADQMAWWNTMNTLARAYEELMRRPELAAQLDTIIEENWVY